jgi:hypothetical protein
MRRPRQGPSAWPLTRVGGVRWTATVTSAVVLTLVAVAGLLLGTARAATAAPAAGAVRAAGTVQAAGAAGTARVPRA